MNPSAEETGREPLASSLLEKGMQIELGGVTLSLRGNASAALDCIETMFELCRTTGSQDEVILEVISLGPTDRPRRRRHG